MLGLFLVPVREWSLIRALQLILAAVLLASLGSRLRRYYRLRDFGGPILAGFSRLWLVRAVWSGKAYLEFWDVTRKHGLFLVSLFPCLQLQKFVCPLSMYSL